MRVEVIDTYPAFLAAEAAWKALEDRDPQTTVFLSWDWMAEAFRDNPYRWSVLAVLAPGQADGFVALLPLKYRVHWSRSQDEFQTQLEAAGRLLFSEYTGFLCDPAFEELSLRHLARHLGMMPWAILSMRYVAQAERAERFCAAFEQMGYGVEWKEYRINKGETDNLICPQVRLPDDFQTYLQTSISANTRQRYNRFKRQHFAKGDYHFTHCDTDSLDADLNILTQLWKKRWIDQKSAQSAEQVAGNFEKMLRAAHAVDGLFLPVLWRGETPLGALGHVMDPRTGAMHFIIAGRDPDAEEMFIGSALHFHSIESAIFLGCETYDFGHGDEAYKFSYGAEGKALQYFAIRRPDADAGNVFDTLCTGPALSRLEGFIETGKIDRAKRACRQLSQIFR